MGLRSLVVVWAAVAVALVVVRVALGEGLMPADTVVTNARIYTARPQRGIAEALAIKTGKIAFVGNDIDARTWIGPRTKVVRLDGRLVLPGLFDSHINPLDIVDFDVCNRSLPGKPALNADQAISIRDAIDAYTISGARYRGRDPEAGSIEVGKSGDLIVLNQDILTLADEGHADDIRNTAVLETWFMGKRIYVSKVRNSNARKRP